MQEDCGGRGPKCCRQLRHDLCDGGYGHWGETPLPRAGCQALRVHAATRLLGPFSEMENLVWFTGGCEQRNSEVDVQLCGVLVIYLDFGALGGTWGGLRGANRDRIWNWQLRGS